MGGGHTVGSRTWASPLHRCAGGGALVGPVGFIPESRLDYIWSPDFHGLGCSHIACRSCGGDVSSELLARADARGYRCDCHTFEATGTCWLDAPAGTRARGPSPPVDWHCAGHPARRLPLALDGIAVGAPAEWRQLLIDAADGRLRPAGPAWLPGYPHAWLERLVATVDASERLRFTELVAGLHDATPSVWQRMAIEIANGLGLGAMFQGARSGSAAPAGEGSAGLSARWLLRGPTAAASVPARLALRWGPGACRSRTARWA